MAGRNPKAPPARRRRQSFGARKRYPCLEAPPAALQAPLTASAEEARIARTAQGQVLRRRTKRGVVWALRFPADGSRHYLTLGSEEEGWTRARAEGELQDILADVRRGIWTSARERNGDIEADGAPEGDPGFHRFASDWLAGRRGEISESAVEYYAWALNNHLLPYFGSWRLAEIDVRAVDSYRRFKVSQAEERRAARAKGRPKPPRSEPAPRPLSPTTINKTIAVLQAVLALAVEYGHIDRNPAAGRRRRLKAPARQPVHLDTAEQIEALLDAAADLDGRKTAQTSGRRVLIATLVLAGLRAGEACALLWRDVDLPNSRIRIRRSKTQAGLREIMLLPLLRDELAAHKATAARTGAEDPVFTTASGRARDKDNLRNRVLGPVLSRADEILRARDCPPLPNGVTPHKLRHTFASILVACGEDPASAMAQLGHTDPKFTLRVYTHLMRRGSEERARLKALVYGEQAADC
jgi:integrase